MIKQLSRSALRSTSVFLLLATASIAACAEDADETSNENTSVKATSTKDTGKGNAASEQSETKTASTDKVSDVASEPGDVEPVDERDEQPVTETKSTPEEQPSNNVVEEEVKEPEPQGPKAYSVDEVLAQGETLKGQEVIIKGYLWEFREPPATLRYAGEVFEKNGKYEFGSEIELRMSPDGLYKNFDLIKNSYIKYQELKIELTGNIKDTSGWDYYGIIKAVKIGDADTWVDVSGRSYDEWWKAKEEKKKKRRDEKRKLFNEAVDAAIKLMKEEKYEEAKVKLKEGLRHTGPLDFNPEMDDRVKRLRAAFAEHEWKAKLQQFSTEAEALIAQGEHKDAYWYVRASKLDSKSIEVPKEQKQALYKKILAAEKAANTYGSTYSVTLASGTKLELDFSAASDYFIVKGVKLVKESKPEDATWNRIKLEISYRGYYARPDGSGFQFHHDSMSRSKWFEGSEDTTLTIELTQRQLKGNTIVFMEGRK